MAIIILSILLTIAIIATCWTYYLYRDLLNHVVNDYKNEPHFCNYCQRAFLHSKEQRAKTTCDYCKRPLTYRPDYIPPNAEKMSEDFDFDTWLENQPEGTFVQGGGIDEENSSKSDKKD